MSQQYKRIAVKIGSNVLTRKDGALDVTRMSALVDQIAELRENGVEVILISSGAVASGRGDCFPQWGRPSSSTAITNCSASTACRWGRC